MHKRLGLVIAATELASVAALLFLLRQPGLPSQFDVLLVFALPISFGLHVMEEFIFPGGGPDWFRAARPQFSGQYTDAYFFRINAIPLALAFLVTLGTFDFAGGFTYFGIRAWLAFVSFQGFNVLFFHVLGMIRTKRYSPGIVTGLVLFVPLVVIAFSHLLRTGVVDVFSAIVAIGIGYAVLAVLDHIKATGVKPAASN